MEASVSTVDLRSPVDLRFLGQVIGRRGPELVDDMMHMLLAQIAELRGDEQVVGRLRASIESNLSAIRSARTASCCRNQRCRSRS